MPWILMVQFGDKEISRDFDTKTGALNALATVESVGFTDNVSNDVIVKYYPASIVQVKLLKIIE